MNHPLAFFLSKSLAAFCTMIPPMALVVFWPVIGAWRADFAVLWMPNLLYLLTSAFPIALAGILTGAFSRALISKEIPSLIMGFVFIAPLLIYRLWGAPANELFFFASASFGILLPMELLIREAAVCYLYAIPFLGAAILTIPSPTPKSSKSKKGFFRLSAPTPTWIVRHILLQARHAGIIRLVLAGGLIAVFTFPAREFRKTFTRPDLQIDWYYAQQPSDTNESMILPLIITERKIEFEQDNRENLSHLKVSLSCRPTTASQSLAAFNFGPYTQCLNVSSTTKGMTVSHQKQIFPEKDSPVVIRLDPPRDNLDQPINITFDLKPFQSSERKWAQAWHPRFHRFSFLGPWYGESAYIHFPNQQHLMVSQPTPYMLTVPNAYGLGWLSGSATITNQGESTVINQSSPGLPNQLVAANLKKTSPSDEGVYPPMDLYFQENRTALAQNFHNAFREPLIQIQRLFGPPPHRLIVYEVPELNPSAPLALSSAQLDRLEVVLPEFDSYVGYYGRWRHRNHSQMNSSKRAFYQAFSRLHFGLVEEIITTNYSGFDHPALLKNGLSHYIHQYALDRGQQYNLRKKTQRDLVLTPWLLAGSRHGYPFDVINKEEQKKWVVPMTRQKDPRDLALNLYKREAAFFHLLRGMMGDEPFRQAIYRMTQDYKGQILTIEILQTEMEKASGLDLSDVFEQWIFQGVLPEFELTLAQAYLYHNEDTGVFEYRIEVTAENKGTGRVEVPWRLETEGEPLKGKQWISPGEKTMFRVTTGDRPVLFELDPGGWVPQLKSKENGHPKVFFKTITEL
jgi:hypothetical protein